MGCITEPVVPNLFLTRIDDQACMPIQ
jgi:hypothetical protein